MRDKLIGNLCSDLSYRELFLHQNHYRIKDAISNNKFDLTMKPVIDGCARSAKFDSNGIVLKAKKIISAGIIKDNFGDIQYGTYLGVDKISGKLPVCELKAEGYDYSKEKHIIIDF